MVPPRYFAELEPGTPLLNGDVDQWLKFDEQLSVALANDPVGAHQKVLQLHSDLNFSCGAHQVEAQLKKGGMLAGKVSPSCMKFHVTYRGSNVSHREGSIDSCCSP